MSQNIEINRGEESTSPITKTRVISAFPCTGKSHFTQIFSLNALSKERLVLDSDSTTFSWLPTEDGGRERNPAFPANYMEHIKQNLGKASLILVSTHQEVTDALVGEGLDFTLVYPKRELKDEYLERCKQRGSPESFVDMLQARWDGFMDHLENQPGCERVELSSGQYLSDLLAPQQEG